MHRVGYVACYALIWTYVIGILDALGIKKEHPNICSAMEHYSGIYITTILPAPLFGASLCERLDFDSASSAAATSAGMVMFIPLNS